MQRFWFNKTINMINPGKILILLILSMSESFLFGQPDCCNCANDQRLLFEPVLTGVQYLPRKTLGTQYFKDTWFTGDVICVNGEEVTSKEIAYNSYLDELIWRDASRLILVCLDKEPVTKFILHENNGNQIVFKHLHGISGNSAGSLDLFAQVLKEDSVAVYVTRRIELDERIETEVQGVIIRNDKLMDAPPVYILEFREHRFLILNKLKAKSFYDLFPDHSTEIKLLLKQHHSSLKTEQDLLKIIRLLENSKISLFSP
jgi:hypothetical protein